MAAEVAPACRLPQNSAGFTIPLHFEKGLESVNDCLDRHFLVFSRCNVSLCGPLQSPLDCQTGVTKERLRRVLRVLPGYRAQCSWAARSTTSPLCAEVLIEFVLHKWPGQDARRTTCAPAPRQDNGRHCVLIVATMMTSAATQSGQPIVNMTVQRQYR